MDDKMTSEEREVVDSSISAILESDDINFASVKEFLSLSEQYSTLSDDFTKIIHERKAELKGLKNKIELQSSELVKQCETMDKEIDKKRKKVKVEEKRAEKIEEEMRKLLSELNLQKAEMVKVCDEAVQKVPKEIYICSVLKNVTNIEWDVKAHQANPDVVRGAFVTKQDIQPFMYDLQEKDNIDDVKESLWGMMKDWQQFEKSVQNEE